jgi:hypothetical protein
MIDPIRLQTPIHKEISQEWKPFFETFAHPVENDQKKEMIDNLTLEIARQIQHHLKKMKEHYRKLRQEKS